MKDQGFGVVIRNDADDHFTAQVIAFPELRSEGATEAEAVERIKDSIEVLLATSKLIKVSVKETNPWLALAGHAADDADFDISPEEIRKYRMEQAARLAEGDE